MSALCFFLWRFLTIPLLQRPWPRLSLVSDSNGIFLLDFFSLNLLIMIWAFKWLQCQQDSLGLIGQRWFHMQSLHKNCLWIFQYLTNMQTKFNTCFHRWTNLAFVDIQFRQVRLPVCSCRLGIQSCHPLTVSCCRCDAFPAAVALASALVPGGQLKGLRPKKRMLNRDFSNFYWVLNLD